MYTKEFLLVRQRELKLDFYIYKKKKSIYTISICTYACTYACRYYGYEKEFLPVREREPLASSAAEKFSKVSLLLNLLYQITIFREVREFFLFREREPLAPSAAENFYKVSS